MRRMRGWNARFPNTPYPITVSVACIFSTRVIILRTKLISLRCVRPKILLLHLKRFTAVERRVVNDSEQNETQIHFEKNNERVMIHLDLSLDRFQTRGKQATVLGNIYSLKSVVHHTGDSPSSGHYIADAYRCPNPFSINPEEAWFTFDDARATRGKIGLILTDRTKQETTYMILYERNENHAHPFS